MVPSTSIRKIEFIYCRQEGQESFAELKIFGRDGDDKAEVRVIRIPTRELQWAKAGASNAVFGSTPIKDYMGDRLLAFERLAARLAEDCTPPY